MANDPALRKFTEDWMTISFELEKQNGVIPTKSEVNQEFISRLTINKR